MQHYVKLLLSHHRGQRGCLRIRDHFKMTLRCRRLDVILLLLRPSRKVFCSFVRENRRWFWRQFVWKKNLFLKNIFKVGLFHFYSNGNFPASVSLAPYYSYVKQVIYQQCGPAVICKKEKIYTDRSISVGVKPTMWPLSHMWNPTWGLEPPTVRKDSSEESWDD